MGRARERQRTTHPVVAKEWRPTIEQLRAEGCTFMQSGHGVAVFDPTGKRIPNLTIGSRSSNATARHIRNAEASLRRHGLLRRSEPTAAKPQKEEPVHERVRRPEVVKAVQEEPPPVIPDPTVSAVEWPRLSLARPVRAHTAHQARLDQIRGRVHRCLKDLGGNNVENRREFARFAEAEARKHGLRLPEIGRAKPDAQNTVYQILMQSLRNYLSGKGQSEWMLDVWETAVQALERPRAAEPVTPAVSQRTPIEGGRTGRVGVGVQVWAEENDQHATGEPSPLVSREELIAALPEPLRERVRSRSDEQLAAAAAADAEEIQELTGYLVCQRNAYIEAMIEKSREGDGDARDRVERILWGIAES